MDERRFISSTRTARKSVADTDGLGGRRCDEGTDASS
jgi:hypothetical protein